MKLREVVSTSRSISATRSRRAKVAGLAELLAAAEPGEIEIVVGFLSGTPRQGRVGVGGASLWAIKPPPAESSEIEVVEVDRAIGRIPSITGPGSRARRLRLLEDLLGRATAGEQDFIRRLLIGELRQGALEGLMMDAVAAATGIPAGVVRRAAMLGGDLGSVARSALLEGEDALRRMTIRPLHPVRPMLATTSGSIADALAALGTASIEWKLDGARIQVHRSGDRVAVFTRRLNEVGARMPSVAAAVRRLPATAIVLDGEAMTHDEEGRVRPFEQTMSRFGSRDPSGGGALIPYFFDILHLDGRDLIDCPLSERIGVLRQALPAEYLVPRIITADEREAAEMLAEARRNRHEGVMVKALDSVYAAGRRGSAWLKVKPAYHLDLVVLAAEWGHGRRTGRLSNLHLGARDAERGGFVMVGKTFKGLTDEMLAWQTERFLEIQTGRDRHIVFVRPETVVEVAFDGVQPSPVYRGGAALRFARVKRYRTDKEPGEADTIEDIYRILKGRL